MAQEKMSAKGDDDRPRDEEGRFTEKEDGRKSSGGASAKGGESGASGSSRAKEGTAKSSGSGGKGPQDRSKSR